MWNILTLWKVLWKRDDLDDLGEGFKSKKTDKCLSIKLFKRQKNASLLLLWGGFPIFRITKIMRMWNRPTFIFNFIQLCCTCCAAIEKWLVTSNQINFFSISHTLRSPRFHSEFRNALTENNYFKILNKILLIKSRLITKISSIQHCSGVNWKKGNDKISENYVRKLIRKRIFENYWRRNGPLEN